jgi:hypothetical protein
VANDYPQIVDKTTLTGVFLGDQFMVVGLEGQKDTVGTAVIGLPVLIRSPDDANTFFGPNSSLAGLCKFLLLRGVTNIVAVASASNAVPILSARQAAWAALEDDPRVRIRLTDSSVQADLVALADSCENCEQIQHKQFAVCQIGVSLKATVIAAATAVASKRAVLTAGQVYDTNGVLLTGPYCAAMVAAMIATNPDITDSFNGADIPATNGIEKDTTTGLPVYRLRTNGGAPQNDFQDLLTGGASPFQQSASGLAAFTHLRTTWVTDTTFDALTTLLYKDQVFLDIRDLLLGEKFLRSGNTAKNRGMAGALVTSYLNGHSDWIAPVNLPDGTVGYGVTVTPSADLKSFTIAYQGQIVRGTNVINIAGSLTIPA